MELKKFARGARSICALGLISLFVAACDDNNNPPGAATTPPPVAAVSPAGQSLVGVDPVNNTVWVPIDTLDGSGNLQFTIVNQSDVTPAIAKATAVKPNATGTGHRISLNKCTRAEAITYDANDKEFLIECVDNSGNVFVEIANTPSDTTQIVVNGIQATGIDAGRGGIIYNPNTKVAVVAGLSTIGLLDMTTATPSFESNSVVSTVCTDSLSLNFTTQLLFIACDGNHQTVDTSSTARPLVAVAFAQLPDPTGQYNPAITDGNAFDSNTNLIVVTPEFHNVAFVLNFNGTTQTPASAPFITVQGLGFTGPVGEGPGGQAVMNTTTHQALIADEEGQNFWLLQLPMATVTGNLNNNGQPGSGTTADASSAYAIAAAVTPQVGGNQLLIRGDPAALGIDQVHNIGYMLADGGSNLYLVAVDLSNPPIGGCAQGVTAPGCTSVWTPKSAAVPLN